MLESQTTAPLVQLRGVTKYFGDFRALDHVDLDIAKGEKVPSMVWIPFELVTPANIKNYLQKN